MINFKVASGISLFLLLTCASPLPAQQPNDIIGSWISLQRNVIVQIYKYSGGFKGKVIWFDDSDDKSRPMTLRTDYNNPVKSLRYRKILGLDVLTGLTYNSNCKCWQNGKIYDVRTGRTWSSSIILENKNQLKVRGFWHFEFIGKSMTFIRIK